MRRKFIVKVDTVYGGVLDYLVAKCLGIDAVLSAPDESGHVHCLINYSRDPVSGKLTGTVYMPSVSPKDAEKAMSADKIKLELLGANPSQPAKAPLQDTWVAYRPEFIQTMAKYPYFALLARKIDSLCVRHLGLTLFPVYMGSTCLVAYMRCFVGNRIGRKIVV